MTQVSGFAKLLLKISDDFSADELKTVKNILEIDDHLTPRQLETVTSMMEIFKLLKKSNLLSESKLELLKSILKAMKREELLTHLHSFESNHQSMVQELGTVQQGTEVQCARFERENYQEEVTCYSECPVPCQPICNFSRSEATTAFPGLLQSQHDSDVTLLKQQLTEEQNLSSPEEVLNSADNEKVQKSEEQICFLFKSSSDKSTYNSTDLPEIDGDQTISREHELLIDDNQISLKAVYTSSSEHLNLTEVESHGSGIIYLRDDRSLFGSSGFKTEQSDAVKPSLSTYDNCVNTSSKQLRGYQLELAAPSLGGRNNIICAPTGSGKTITAGFIFQERWKMARREGKKFRGLFIVCQRTLVTQQRLAVEDFLTPNEGIFISTVEANQLLKDVLSLPYDLIFLTAQKLVNALEARTVKIEDFEMLIMDECHHTDLNHSYNKIMRFYHQMRNEKPNSVLPMIVGLTASLGVGDGKHETAPLQHYINICANLNCMCITHVRQCSNRQELLHFSPKPCADQIKAVEPRHKESPFYKVMNRFMRNIEIETQLCSQEPKDHGTQMYENWIVDRSKEALQSDNLPHIIVACDVLRKLNLAWMLHDEMRIKDAKEFLEPYFSSSWLPLRPIPIQHLIHEWFMEASKQLEELVEKESIEQCPQLCELSKLLRHLHRNHLDPRGILLTRTRLGVERLIKFLQEQMEFQEIIFPGKFVGQGGIEGTMTQADQENTLRRFRLSKEDPTRINLLVATDVAQEGLDMPKCNYVIRYNFVSNEIGSVQSRGRARAPNSELYLIVTRGSVNETRELENLQKEHKMQEALKDIDRIEKEQLRNDITQLQNENWLRYQSQLARDQARSSSVNCLLVTIHCSKCKAHLCNAPDLRLRGSNYICIAEDFESHVIFKEIPNGKEFISEVHMGKIFCKALGCPGNKLGLKIKYKQGSRTFGFVLGKEGCVWQQKDNEVFIPIKQWSKVPFSIEKELI